MIPERLHYLFVCYGNTERSPTAAAVCRRVASQHGLEIEASSAGTSDRAHRPVTKKMADLADKIFVMEPGMVMEMVEVYGQNPAKVICLDIPDVYDKNDPWLVGILENKLCEYLAQEGLL
jgi:predicted protein tyrosine phosphatase